MLVSNVPKSGSFDAQKLDMWSSQYNQELMCCFPLGVSWAEEMLPDFSLSDFRVDFFFFTVSGKQNLQKDRPYRRTDSPLLARGII